MSDLESGAAMENSALPGRLVVSNDDGIDAPGLQTLVQAVQDWADCLVMAPDGPRSGVGHALSDGEPIRVRADGPSRFAISGTPADCARLALSASGPVPREWQGRDEHAEWQGLRRRRQIWLLAGINHGANLGVDTYVSGTVAAAREAAILGFPALAISQLVGRHRQPDWDRTLRRALPVLRRLLQTPPAPGAFWNVNLPHPNDERVDCEIVHCAVDPSPLPVRYERRGDAFAYTGDYHARPRRPGHDIDVCFGGGIAVSEIPIHPTGAAPTSGG